MTEVLIAGTALPLHLILVFIVGKVPDDRGFRCFLIVIENTTIKMSSIVWDSRRKIEKIESVSVPTDENIPD